MLHRREVETLQEVQELARLRLDAEIIEAEKAGERLEVIERRKTEFQIEQARERLRLLLESGELASEIEIQAAKNTIAALELEMQKLSGEGESGGGDGNFISKILGISAEDGETIMEEGAKIVNSFKSILSQLAQARIDAANRELEASRDRLSGIENALQSELDLQEAAVENGAAYDTQRIEQLEQRQAEEAEIQKQALAEQQKAQALKAGRFSFTIRKTERSGQKSRKRRKCRAGRKTALAGGHKLGGVWL